MQGGPTTLLPDFWYLAFPARSLRRGRVLAKRILGEPLLFARRDDGRVFALRDICPHRGIPLRYGRFDGCEVECCYHGWRFDADGRCRAIPSLAPGQEMEIGRIRTRSYPCRERHGNVWVWIASDPRRLDESALPEPPALPGSGEALPKVAISRHFPCSADHAAFGLMDPTHAAFVHTSWWWKKGATTLRNKEKHFEPAPLGWRMKRHRLPAENRAYRLLGGVPTTEITYSLPGIRIEQVEGERHSVVNLTAITPLDEGETEVHNLLYWTMPWLGPARPLIRHLASRFLEQDRRVVLRQQEGLAYRPSLMLIEDADTQAKWFERVKREWLRAREEARPFENPVKSRTLRWRS